MIVLAVAVAFMFVIALALQPVMMPPTEEMMEVEIAEPDITYGRLVGSIGPVLSKEEPVHFVADRLLSPVKESSPKLNLGGYPDLVGQY